MLLGNYVHWSCEMSSLHIPIGLASRFLEARASFEAGKSSVTRSLTTVSQTVFCELGFADSVHQPSLCASSSSGTKPKFKNAVSGGVAAIYEMNSSSPAASGLGSLSQIELTNTNSLLSSVPV